jgi:hypothetical protein
VTARGNSELWNKLSWARQQEILREDWEEFGYDDVGCYKLECHVCGKEIFSVRPDRDVMRGRLPH